MLTLYIADVERDVGMKKLSQEEAAKVLEDMKVKMEIPKAAVTQWKKNTALDMAIEALKHSEVPNSSDCISRQAAIDVFEDTTFTKNEIRRRLSELQSVQPEPSEITDEQAILHLQSTGWMQNHDKEMYESGQKSMLADDSGSYDALIPD